MGIQVVEILVIFKDQIKNFGQDVEVVEVGQVLLVGDGIVCVYGLDKVQVGEMVEFFGGICGMVLNFEIDNVGIVIFGDDCLIKEGDIVKCIGIIVEVFVGKGLLGCVVDGLGNLIDGKGLLVDVECCVVDVKVFGIMLCKLVYELMVIGLKLVDVMIFVGCGQCELIIGDCQIGKIVIVLDIILNQVNYNGCEVDGMKILYCIYVVVGQKCLIVVQLVKKLEEIGVMVYMIVVVVIVLDLVLMQYLVFYLVIVMGEYFCDNGMDVLIIYDDLFK